MPTALTKFTGCPKESIGLPGRSLATCTCHEKPFGSTCSHRCRLPLAVNEQAKSILSSRLSLACLSKIQAPVPWSSCKGYVRLGTTVGLPSCGITSPSCGALYIHPAPLYGWSPVPLSASRSTGATSAPWTMPATSGSSTLSAWSMVTAVCSTSSLPIARASRPSSGVTSMLFKPWEASLANAGMTTS